MDEVLFGVAAATAQKFINAVFILFWSTYLAREEYVNTSNEYLLP